MKIDKQTLLILAGVYVAGSVVASLYIQPWSTFWQKDDNQALAWEYTLLWPWAVYKLGGKAA
jgi:hypothetical protein